MAPVNQQRLQAQSLPMNEITGSDQQRTVSLIPILLFFLKQKPPMIIGVNSITIFLKICLRQFQTNNQCDRKNFYHPNQFSSQSE